MKKYLKTLLTLMSFIFCNNILAEEVKLTLHNGRNNNPDRVKDRRSITLEPTATIDENTIRIYTDVAVSELQVSIKDNMGNIVYTCNDMIALRCHTFEVYDLPTGEYILEIEIGDESYYGHISFAQNK